MEIKKMSDERITEREFAEKLREAGATPEQIQTGLDYFPDEHQMWAVVRFNLPSVPLEGKTVTESITCILEMRKEALRHWGQYKGIR